MRYGHQAVRLFIGPAAPSSSLQHDQQACGGVSMPAAWPRLETYIFFYKIPKTSKNYFWVCRHDNDDKYEVRDNNGDAKEKEINALMTMTKSVTRTMNLMRMKRM